MGDWEAAKKKIYIHKIRHTEIRTKFLNYSHASGSNVCTLKTRSNNNNNNNNKMMLFA